MVMGHLSEMFNSAGKEKVEGQSNVTLGHKPSDWVGNSLKNGRRSSAYSLAREIW